jgi:STIP1 family protein 1
LIAEKKFTDAAKSLQRALEEARESGDMIQDDVWRELARAKYLEWELLASDRDRRYSHLENSVRNFSSQLDAEDVSTMGEVIACARAPDDRSCEPPDAFCCKLTFEVFRDPVIAPSGHSYERLAILQHLKISQFDPITREPLRPEQLISNVNLRNASHAWLSTHAWAFGDIVRPNAPLE